MDFPSRRSIASPTAIACFLLLICEEVPFFNSFIASPTSRIGIGYFFALTDLTEGAVVGVGRGVGLANFFAYAPRPPAEVL